MNGTNTRIKKYRLVDFYDDNEELIGEYSTKKELVKAYDERVKETDGECLLKIGILQSKEMTSEEVEKKEKKNARKGR